MDGMFAALAKAPDTQIATEITAKLAVLAERGDVKASELKDILNECAYASLASDWAMRAMHLVYATMLEAENKASEA